MEWQQRQYCVIMEHSEVESRDCPTHLVFFSIPALDPAPVFESRPTRDVGQSMIQLCYSRHLQRDLQTTVLGYW